MRKYSREVRVAVSIAALLAAVLAFSAVHAGESVWDEAFWRGADSSGGGAPDDIDGWGGDIETGGGSRGSAGAAGAPPPPASMTPELKAIYDRAVRGDNVAQFDMGLAYFLGRHGLGVDLRGAARWFELSAANGNLSAMGNAGVILVARLPDDGTPARKEEIRRGFAHLTNAAGKGDATAQYNLGVYHRDGKGVEPNALEAIKWFEMAGNNGEAEACDSAGVLLFRGGRQAEAYAWFVKGSELFHPNSTFNAGVFHRNGMGGLEKDEAEAFAFFRRAAGLGSVPGMYTTGSSYMQGRGCRKDLSKAKRWLLLAKEHGEQDADKLLAEIPADVPVFDPGLTRITVGELAAEFAASPGAALEKYQDRVVVVSGGSSRINMASKRIEITLVAGGSPVVVQCVIPTNRGERTVFDYSKGRGIRGVLTRFSPGTNVIHLENAENVAID